MPVKEEQWRKVVEVLMKLDEAGCLEHMMLVGSWADFLYSASGYLPDYESRIRTLDLDFLVYNIRKPNPPKNVITTFKEMGFIVERDRMTGVTKLLDPSTGFEIEFLAQLLGSGTERYIKTNLGVTAQGLREFRILSNNRIELSYLGMNILVPKPEAFLINKMVINHGRSEAKAEKDREAIINMYPYIDADEFQRIKESLSKKEYKLVVEFEELYLQKGHE